MAEELAHAPRPGVAVFGAAAADTDAPLYERARSVGRALAERGLAVVTGGYGGVMEAASRGAREAGGEAIGVTCSVFRGRVPNPYLSLEIEEPDLCARTGRLIHLARGFVVLEGNAGTLAELATLWAYARANVLPGPIALWDEAWARIVDDLQRAERLDARAARQTRVAASLAEAVSCALGEPS
jgi:hypothetical protein